jgi:hypothetical protein
MGLRAEASSETEARNGALLLRGRERTLVECPKALCDALYIFHRHDNELVYSFYFDDGKCFFLRPAVGHVYDTALELVAAVELIEQDERVGHIDIGDFKSHILVS